MAARALGLAPGAVAGLKAWFSMFGRAMLHAVLPALTTFAVGFLAMPNLDGTKLYGTVFLIALFAGLGKVLQEIPFLSASLFLPQPYAAWVDAVVRTGVASLAVLLSGMGGAADLNTAHAMWSAGIAGVGAAIIRAIEGLLTPGETPAPQAFARTA